MTPRRSCLLGALVLLVGCAVVQPPPGGAEDRTPPVPVAFTPAPKSVQVPSDAPLEIEFTEWIDPSTLPGRVRLEPAAGPRVQVQAFGRFVRVDPGGALDSSTTYALVVEPGLADYRGQATSEMFSTTFSTGIALDTLSVRVKTASVNVSHLRLGLWDPSRRTAWTLRSPDSTQWLLAPPRPWRERPRHLVRPDTLGVLWVTTLPGRELLALMWDDADQDGLWRPGHELAVVLGSLMPTRSTDSVLKLPLLAPLDSSGPLPRPENTAVSVLVFEDLDGDLLHQPPCPADFAPGESWERLLPPLSDTMATLSADVPEITPVPTGTLAP